MNQNTPSHYPGREPRGGAGHRDGGLLALTVVALSLLLLLLCLFVPIAWRQAGAEADAWEAAHSAGGAQTGEIAANTSDPAGMQVGTQPDYETYMPRTTDATILIGESEIDAGHAILVDLTTGQSVAERLADEQIWPASMTKVMTVLVAAEALDPNELEMTYTVTADIVDAAVAVGASRAGFAAGEPVKLIDLLYGAALPSGADATAALARYIAGSEEAYVVLMNKKAEEMGLKKTHFVNVSGLHHEDHYSTVREVAALMAYAMENDLCRKVLSATEYTTSATEAHPFGINLYSTTFSRMSNTAFGPVKVIAGKTGYTDEARFCLVSLAAREDGREYILVTVGGSSKYAPVYDCDAVYGKYLF